ncbi:MAG: cell division protein FtsZ, partial [Halocynthiibacter sp.]
GLGAGARPSVGAAAAEEAIEAIVDHLAGAHMCFITAGMGGGTGTGAAPIIAQAARELGVLTVGVVTKPFQFEGAKRMQQAEGGVEALQKVVDTLIIIPNQNLFRLANEKTTFTEAFSLADDVLYQGVKGVTDLMVRPGLINLDFADVRAVMDEMGKAMMGTGESEGEDRAIQAAEKAIANPLLDEISLRGAKGVLINITGGYDLTLFELDEAANRIREEVDAEANIIVGSTLDTAMEGLMRVSVVATGIDVADSAGEMPAPRRRLSEPLQPVATSGAVAETQSTEMPATAPTQAEPSLFGGIARDGAATAVGQGERADQAGNGDLPLPAYRPRPQEFQPREDDHDAESVAAQSEAAEFVAPKAPSPGTPSPEALARLQAAVQKNPTARASGTAVRRPPVADRETTPGESEQRTRFGINSLINRMTGHGGDSEDQDNQSLRQQPPAQAYDDEIEADPEQERVEIPAFLRRQAN